MIISDIRLSPISGGYELSGDVRFETIPDSRHRVWFRGEPGTPPPDISGDPFFAGFFVPAMALRENLTIEADVTPELIQAAIRRVQPVMLKWHPGFRAPAIETGGAIRAPLIPGTGVLCNFSGGLDSWDTFLNHREEVTHVMHCQGFDRVQSFTDPRYIRKMQDMARQQADRYGKTYVGLTTNLTAIGSQAMNRARYQRGLPVDLLFQRHAYFGSELVALAHVYGSRFKRYYIASSQTYDRNIKFGSNPLTDPAWSIPRLEIVHDGAGLDRTDKIERIFRNDPEALNSLYVCHSEACLGENCNDCEKCLRTRGALHVAGVLDRCSTLRSPLDLEEIRRFILEPDTALWKNLLDAAQRRGNSEMAAAIEVAMGRRFNLARCTRNLLGWIRLACRREGRKQIRRKTRRVWVARRARLLSSI